MKKEVRIHLYNETKGRCGYCGRNIDIKDMQIDHIIPQREYGYIKSISDNILNLLCSCRKCNHYKRAQTLNGFRKSIETLHERLRKIYIFEVGMNFGITELSSWSGKFYFEIIGLEKGSK